MDKYIHNQSRDGDVGRIEEQIRKGVSVDSRGAGNRTPLMWAALYNHQDAAKCLYKNGCNLNLQSDYGDTAAHMAARNGHGKMVQLLANWGADLKIRNREGKTPVDIMK